MSDNEESSSSSCNIEDIAGEMNLDIGKQMTMASYCTNCGKQAVTRMLFITVPKFREMMVSSIKCRHCGFFGRDIQQVAEIQNFGSIATLEAKCARDLSRGVVKSSTCTVKIPTIGFEIQARPMSGVYTTVEGLLRSAADNLGLLQTERRQRQPEVASKIDDVILQLLDLIQQCFNNVEPKETIFTLELTDPTGNSFIEPFGDLPHLKEKQFQRTMEEAEDIGLTREQEKEIQKEARVVKVDENMIDDIVIAPENTTTELPSFCPACQKPVIDKAIIINIPYFKDVLLMCCKCDECGYKTIEIQQAGAIPKMGRKHTLHVTDPSDLSREVLKSTSCSIKIIELGIELQPGTLGGMYTTLEGLMKQLTAELLKHSQFWMGDSARNSEENANWTKIANSLELCCQGKMNFTIEIDDPLDGSFIKNIYAPDPDPEMKVESYKRSQEQDEEYGLDDIDQGDE
ncbi:ZPR1_zinc-finger domain-containing protein [Hexamita inflata]|uniref:ZPR1 zinc-finger domain-containing protein n=2 Tax=Hexamita inflata TaxID=28002 RepID=A0AA86NLC7_9EUKA|nr:ZPR1 zinc-finger domain-containing protein [Hexamita inflata]CAI9936484.1 ZPR1 zinc-finger domain-containing protein [Hexamita inflata]CAI9967519.1 ZPR1 zinc-finger domain-containing protein [Hexamita inflata]